MVSQYPTDTLCLFTSLCHLICTINNLKQCKRIVRARGQNVHERDLSNSGTITKYGHTEDVRLQEEDEILIWGC
jgi:hypothetical protein